ncbi:SDR family NAD(P)-dependent oxidoreductase [Salinimicrobium sp. TH3]|uniref:SDR family NAD(P)-dependent oxidoreductase n=1 Tax=Salinimicrobium sp. TH3 TaxID=2997342 RepID=UPI002275BC8D|nr:glucose 1-dehydrogenase [Salinimicrobium sp. TH3]MCY2685554.1 glucose 1-dehydrogenase [Salinimicrobium sp. TH3]
MGKLDGKVALITGSDSGIGQASAIALAKEGANVVVTYHTDEEGAKETLQKIELEGRKGIVIKVDISEEKEVESMFDKALEEFGKINILMNNAAIDGQGFKVAEMPTRNFDKAIKINLYGTFFCTRRFIKELKKQKSKGKIINVSSVHEEIPAPGTAEYCASKGAVRNFTRVLALELAEEGINVNNIAPGMILTPMNQEAIEDKKTREDQVQHIPMKRAGKPEEIGKLAVFLASSDSDYVTGSTYVMDGGLMQNVGQGA